MNKHLSSRLGTFCCAAVLLLSGCQSTEPAGSSFASQAEPSTAVISGTIGICKSAETLQLYGYPDFYESGYTAQMQEYEDPAQPLRDLVQGELDFCAAPLSAVIKARTQGEPVVILCNLTGRGIAVVAGSNTGIESLTDLPGKRVGYTPDITGYTLTLLALQQAGMDSSTIEWVEIMPDQANEKLQAGELDAYCGTAYSAGEAILNGFGKIIATPYQEDTLGTANQVMVTTEAVISQKRDWLQQMVDTHRQSTENFRESPSFYLNEAESLKMNREAIVVEQENMDLLWDIEEEFIICTRNLAAKMLDAGMISEMPDLSKLFDMSFLEKAKEHFLS